MAIGGGEETEKESSGGFQFEEIEHVPCFVKDTDIKVRVHVSRADFPEASVWSDVLVPTARGVL